MHYLADRKANALKYPLEDIFQNRAAIKIALLLESGHRSHVGVSSISDLLKNRGNRSMNIRTFLEPLLIFATGTD